MIDMEKPKIYSEKIRGRGRHYFMDIRTAENGGNYLVLTESRKDKEKEGEYQNSRIMLFGDDVDAFYAALGRTVNTFHEHRNGESRA